MLRIHRNLGVVNDGACFVCSRRFTLPEPYLEHILGHKKREWKWWNREFACLDWLFYRATAVTFPKNTRRYRRFEWEAFKEFRKKEDVFPRTPSEIRSRLIGALK